MDQDYLPTQGDPVSSDSLTFTKALDLVRFLKAELNPFARLLECLANPQEEVVVLEVDVELPQRPTHDIRHSERLAVAFCSDDLRQPEVLALRPDFPVVPHLNQRITELPRSLCLYDRPYHEIKLHWTPARFVEAIRYWLMQTAIGKLHAQDQPLEPLLFDPAHELVLPEDLLNMEAGTGPEWLTVQAVRRSPTLFTLIASRWDGGKSQETKDFLAFVVSSAPQMHGVIRRTPNTILELHEFLADCGLDLLDLLRQALKDWMITLGTEFQSILEARLILVVRLPKTREPGGEAETVEVRAFAISATIKQIGVDIGLWELNQGKPGLLLSYDETSRGTDTTLASLNPRPAFSRFLAARVNGLDGPNPLEVIAVGVGALGSQVVTNLVKAGFGQWTLIDDDVLLPHNLGRHSLQGFALGFPKATAMAEVLNATIEGKGIARGIVADVLRPEENAQSILSAFSEAEVILDMSASVSVARYLSRDVATEGRRISLFLNPLGTALTMLAEDASRRIPLDSLEMQFYREIATNGSISQLFGSHGQIRTGQSCRDISVQIPQDRVALFAALGSQAFRDTVETEMARITVWQVDDQSLTVSAVAVDPAEPWEDHIGEWTLYTDVRLLERLSELRHERLPKETGGILVGAYDVGRKIIYIVDTVPSPIDSEEWPTAYIRGSKGLGVRIQEIGEATDGMIQYIGEWHSHPSGAGVTPSGDDQKVLGWVGAIMDREALPGVMVIVGDEGELGVHLGGQAA